MVYVLDIEGQPLMPTKRYGKVRRMLRDGKAKVITRTPYTIQLNYEPETHIVQDITLGIDPDKECIGFSAQVEEEKKELYAAEVELRKDLKKVVKKRKELRQSRRSRNKARKSHRISEGIKFNKKFKFNLYDMTYGYNLLNSLKRVLRILPISKINMETTQIPPMNSIENNSYEFSHVGNYMKELSSMRTKVLNRDLHTCQCCFGKSKDKILVTRYLENSIIPKNQSYITLCTKCKDKLEKMETGKNGKEEIEKIIYNHINFLDNNENHKYGRINPTLFHSVCELGYMYNPNMVCKRKYGMNTKLLRHISGIKYSPIDNARLIVTTDHYHLKKSKEYFYYKLRKHHDRSLHKITPKKGGIRPVRSPKIINGFSSYDEVKYIGEKYPEYYGKTFFITKKRKTGYFGIGSIEGKTLINSVKSIDLKLITKRKTYSVERKTSY